MYEKKLREAIEARKDGIARYLAEHGRFYPGQALPRRYRVALPKNCYWNARDLVTRSKGKLRYAEGLCYDGKSGYGFAPFEHAWALDAEDRVIDPTVQDSKGRSDAGYCGYFGAVIPLVKGERLFPGGSLYRSPLWRAVYLSLA